MTGSASVCWRALQTSAGWRVGHLHNSTIKLDVYSSFSPLLFFLCSVNLLSEKEREAAGLRTSSQSLLSINQWRSIHEKLCSRQFCLQFYSLQHISPLFVDFSSFMILKLRPYISFLVSGPAPIFLRVWPSVKNVWTPLLESELRRCFLCRSVTWTKVEAQPEAVGWVLRLEGHEMRRKSWRSDRVMPGCLSSSIISVQHVSVRGPHLAPFNLNQDNNCQIQVSKSFHCRGTEWICWINLPYFQKPILIKHVAKFCEISPKS